MKDESKESQRLQFQLQKIMAQRDVHLNHFRQLGDFVSAYDAWITSKADFDGPLFEDMLRARNEATKIWPIRIDVP